MYFGKKEMDEKTWSTHIELQLINSLFIYLILHCPKLSPIPPIYTNAHLMTKYAKTLLFIFGFKYQSNTLKHSSFKLH